MHLQLARESARFKTLAEASFEGIIIHDRGIIIDVNNEASRVLNCKPDELLGQNLLKRFPVECQRAILDEADRPYEGEIISRKGDTIPVEIRTKNLDFAESSVSVTAIRDLSVQKTIENENRVLKVSLEERYKFGNIVGRSPAMKKVYELVSQAASSDFHVIITGESGTGKELVAKAIHQRSSRKNRPLLKVDCASLPPGILESELFGHMKGAFTDAKENRPGRFELASGGTLFLDEIGNLSLPGQAACHLRPSTLAELKPKHPPNT